MDMSDYSMLPGEHDPLPPPFGSPPPSSSSNGMMNMNDSSDQLLPYPPVGKRPRGRPRKHPLPIIDPDVPKRGRGRPPKTPEQREADRLAKELAIEANGGPLPKKPRKRKTKEPVEQPVPQPQLDFMLDNGDVQVGDMVFDDQLQDDAQLAANGKKRGRPLGSKNKPGHLAGRPKKGCPPPSASLPPKVKRPVGRPRKHARPGELLPIPSTSASTSSTTAPIDDLPDFERILASATNGHNGVQVSEGISVSTSVVQDALDFALLHASPSTSRLSGDAVTINEHMLAQMRAHDHNHEGDILVGDSRSLDGGVIDPRLRELDWGAPAAPVPSKSKRPKSALINSA